MVGIKTFRDRIEICRWKNGKRGAVTLTFDDGCKDTYLNAIPALNSHGMRGTFAIPINIGHLFGNVECSLWSDWMKVKEAGHELASHGITHKRFDTLSNEELENELKKPVEELGATTLVYPFGRYDSKVKLRAKRYYLSARTTGYNGLNPSTPPDMFALKSYEVTSYLPYPPLIALNLRAKYAEVRGLWLIETYHLISDHPNDYPLFLSPKAFNMHLNYLRRLNIWVDTLENVSKYIIEREHIKIVDAKVTKGSVKIELYSNLDPKVFNIPLSVKWKGKFFNVNSGEGVLILGS